MKQIRQLIYLTAASILCGCASSKTENTKSLQSKSEEKDTMEYLSSSVRNSFQNDVSWKKESSVYRWNDYSGLNSLRARMNAKDVVREKNATERTVSQDNTVRGSAVNFFFGYNSARLTSVDQQLNILEVARAAKEKGLKVTVVGSADNITGSASHNQELSQKRAAYIVEELVKRGVPRENITFKGEGGIMKYKPASINRKVRVIFS